MSQPSNRQAPPSESAAGTERGGAFGELRSWMAAGSLRSAAQLLRMRHRRAPGRELQLPGCTAGAARKCPSWQGVGRPASGPALRLQLAPEGVPGCRAFLPGARLPSRGRPASRAEWLRGTGKEPLPAFIREGSGFEPTSSVFIFGRKWPPPPAGLKGRPLSLNGRDRIIAS